MYSSNATSYSNYLSGEINVTVSEEVVELTTGVSQLLIYTTEPCYIKLNDNDNEIFLSGNMWMPLSLSVKTFSIRTVSGEAVAHWQGWYM